jgi:hypothetical protein
MWIHVQGFTLQRTLSPLNVGAKNKKNSLSQDFVPSYTRQLIVLPSHIFRCDECEIIILSQKQGDSFVPLQPLKSWNMLHDLQ